MTGQYTMFPVYEMSLNVRVTWQAHSLSTSGSNGSNKLMPRRQLLADGTETDACSGAIAKHHHSALLAQYLQAAGVPLCPACRRRDSRRAGALVDLEAYKQMTIDQILTQCGLCDAHGFLVTAKNAGSGGQEARQGIRKDTLIDYSFALALPGRHAETVQLTTRMGDSKDEGQMLMKMTARSGEYALVVRYLSVGVGMDVQKWHLAVTDPQQRLQRHQAILLTLRDTLLSPDGALTAAMLPHLTGLEGALVIRTGVGRAPTYSALKDDFITRLQAMESETCRVTAFETVDGFHSLMEELIQTSYPSLPPTSSYTAPRTSISEGEKK